MSNTNKYPELSNADLAELLGLNRLIQFDKLPEHFKRSGTYVPYGHDLIEEIQRRLREEEPDDELIDPKQREVTIDLSYYFERNIDLKEKIVALMNEYKVETPVLPSMVASEIVNKINELELIAKNVRGGPQFFVTIKWDIAGAVIQGEVLSRSHIDCWVIHCIHHANSEPSATRSYMAGGMVPKAVVVSGVSERRLSDATQPETFSIYSHDWPQCSGSVVQEVTPAYWGKTGEIIQAGGITPAVKVDLTFLKDLKWGINHGVYFDPVNAEFHVYQKHPTEAYQVTVFTAQGNERGATYRVARKPE